MNLADYDYIVVGRGLCGSAAARHLVQPNLKVALVGPSEPASRQAHQGVFASHYDEGRITRIIDPNPVWALLAKRAISRYSQLEEVSGIHFYYEVGHLTFGQESGESLKYIESLCTSAVSLDVDIEVLSTERLRETFPYLRFPERAVGVWQKGNAGHLSPRSHVQAQTEALRRLGGIVIEQRVLSVQAKDDIFVVSTEGGRLTGRGIIVATGAFTNPSQILPRPIPLTLKARTVLLAEIEPSELERLALMPSIISKPWERDAHFYLLPPILYPNGKWYVKIGGSFATTLSDSLEALQGWFKSKGDQKVTEHLKSILQATLPEIRFREWHTDTCVTTHTPTGYPYIDFVENQPIVTLVGGNGLAGKSADELGLMAAKLLQSRRWSYDLSPDYFQLP